MGLDNDADLPELDLDQLDPEDEAFWRVRGFPTRPGDWQARLVRERDEEERALGH